MAEVRQASTGKRKILNPNNKKYTDKNAKIRYFYKQRNINTDYINNSNINKLFTSEEKSIFKNYNFIPEEKVDSYEQKYTDILEQISQTERKMKKLGKKNDKKLLNIKCEIIKNDKKKKDLKKICVSNSIIIKKKAKKIQN